jgi:hypothetical protein
MLSLAQTLEDQRDLERLCAERERPRGETLDQNALYGHGRILKMAAGLPLDRPVWAVIPHGVSLGTASSWDVGAPVPTAYSFMRDKDDALSQQGRRALIRGAAPWVHLDEMIGAPPPGRRGTLFFPAHTIKGIDYDVEYDAVADALVALPAALQPVRVCVYWADFLKGQHRPFVERGLEVVSAGHNMDPLFPWRLRHLLSQHAVAASNTFATHTVYALHAGLHWLHVSTGPIRHRAEPGREADYKPSSPDFVTVLESLLDVGAPVRPAAAVQLADDLLGVQRQLAPHALAHALVSAERRHRLSRAA